MNYSFVFVYGSLRSGLKNNNYLSSSEYIGDFETQKEFHMITYNKSSFPYLLEDLDIIEPPSIIKGEIYKVNQYVLNKLDVLEVHPDIYQRKLYKFTCNKETIEAWVYILVKPEIINYIKKELGDNYTLVQSGDWTDFLLKTTSK